MTIKEAIQYYKENLDACWDAEDYKWEAVKCFKDNWDLNAGDFKGMLEKSLAKIDNLLAGSYYYPIAMINRLIDFDQDGVRNLFAKLFDESVPVSERIPSFRKGCDEILEKYHRVSPENAKHKKSFQDLRVISMYLTFNCPEKHFLYKASIYNGFKKIINYKEISNQKDRYSKRYENYTNLCSEVIEAIKNDPELQRMQKEKLQQDKKYYEDPEFHMLAQTIIYVCPGVNDASSKKTEMDDNEYWPSEELYNPEISTEDWIEILENQELTTENNLRMLAMILNYGKPASCVAYAERYGKSSGYFIGGSQAYAKRLVTKNICEKPPEEKDAKWWPVLYVGRIAKKEERGEYIWKLRDELKDALGQVALPDIEIAKENEMDFAKNMILYGPPGTGKTYNTVIYAVAIIENRPIEEVEEEASADYESVKTRYEKYKEAGQIAFTTFHQSYGYEEFIEGIKPRLTEDDLDSDLDYSVESGVFKAFCEKASTPKQSESTNYGLNKSPTVWKVSLAGTYDNPVREECLKNNHIRVGWDSYGPDITDDMDYNRGGKFVLNAFMNSMKIGDIVLSCYSASTIDAIGVVTGEYEWDESFDEYKRIRKVNWLLKGINEDIVELNGGATMTLSTVYKMKVTVGDVLKLLEKFKGNGEQSSTIPNDDNYVFIIDEINRGNISKIFGELITLIEDNKRLGAKEELTVKLPYSPNKPFGVPQNVYILGTMNTADRSIALMDTALRRRFEFVEVMPEPQVLRELGANYVKTNGQDLDVAKMLETINRRIEYLYDREHTIGHAFFTALSNNNTIECLAGIFKNKVIPLLQEYFFEDYEKIQLVLGDNDKSKECYKFVKDTKVNENDIFKKSPQLDLHEKTYEINDEAFICIESYIEIYEERKAEE